MKNFTTIFPLAQNVHLIKDVGQVANTIASLEGYESKLVCYRNSKSYPLLEAESKHLKIDFIEPCGKKLFMDKAILEYIRQHALQIDIIHFFHLTKETIYYALHYKKYNQNGRIYVKMDVYNEMLEQEIRYSKKPLFNWLHKRKEQQFFKELTAISVENPTALELLKKKFPALKDKALLLTNGVNDAFLKQHFTKPKAFNEKENIILSVGRIGAKEKNFEMLLFAFANANLIDWKLVFIGPVENNFEEKVKKLISRKPELSGKVELIGSIEDRITLYEHYNRSKVCALSSPYESFGITFIEAMYFGNYVIGTEGMSSFNYITDNMRLGMAVEANNEKALVKALQEKTSNEVMLEDNYLKAQTQVKKHFYWSEIIKSLVKSLEN